MSEATEVVNPQIRTVSIFQDVGFGEDFDQSDIEIPRGKLITFTSNETKDPDPSKRIPAGTFINSVSKQIISTEFCPILAYKNYVRFNPMKSTDRGFDPNFEPGKLIFSTRDRHDQRVVEGLGWGDNQERPIVTKVFNYLVYIKGENFPLVISFKSTSYKGARRLNTLLLSAGGKMYTNKYNLKFNMETKAGNSYYVMDVIAAGKSTPEEIALCAQFEKQFGNKDVESMAHQEEAIVTAESTETEW